MLKLVRNYYRGSHCSRFDFVTLLYCPCLVNFFVEKCVMDLIGMSEIRILKFVFLRSKMVAMQDNL